MIILNISCLLFPSPIGSVELQAYYFVRLLSGFLENQIWGWGLKFGEQVSLPTQLSRLLSIWYFVASRKYFYLTQNKSDREYVIVNT